MSVLEDISSCSSSGSDSDAEAAAKEAAAKKQKKEITLEVRAMRPHTKPHTMRARAWPRSTTTVLRRLSLLTLV